MIIDGKPAVAIMLSGGVESTALVQHALNSDLYPLCHFTSLFPNTHPHLAHVKAIAELYGVELYEWDMEKRAFNPDHGHQTKSWYWWSLYGAMLGVAYPDIKEIWIGANCGVRRPFDIPNDPDPYELYARPLKLIESGSDMVDGTAKARLPLAHKTKLEQWHMIPEHIRPHIVTCERQFEFGQPRCGLCRKCIELASVYEDEQYAQFCN